MDVVVEVGGWEHECCGDAIEPNQLVDLRCIRWTAPDGSLHLVESHHGGLSVEADERVEGRVVWIELVQEDGSRTPLARLPAGSELCGSPGLEDDDGMLEHAWTGEVFRTDSRDFRVTVRTAH